MSCVAVAVAVVIRRFLVIRRFYTLALLMLGWSAAMAATTTSVPPPPELLTNLVQLRSAAMQSPPVVHPLRIVADILDADSTNGLLVLRDASSVEFIRADFKNRDAGPGATICLEASGCAVRPNGFGLEIVPGMAVDNDGVHPPIPKSGSVFLPAGRNPIIVKWFNWYGDFGLTVEYEGPGLPRQKIPGTVLSRSAIDPATGRTAFSTGLDYRCYEGIWEFMPDFEKYRPAKTGVATNFDINARTRDAAVGLEFNGFITIPTDGVYTFHVTSDDGSLLFVGNPSVGIRVLNQQPVSAAARPAPSVSGKRNNRPWMTLEGEVTYQGDWNTGGELQMRAGADDILVELFQNGQAAPAIPPHGKVRVSGIYEDVLNANGYRVSGRLLTLNWNAVQSAAPTKTVPVNVMLNGGSTNAQTAEQPGASAASIITTAAEIMALSPDMAKRKLPVSIRGVVTVGISGFLGGVVQDSTKGVFVNTETLLDAPPLQYGEFYQIEGVTGPGLFAPVVVASRVTHLGPGALPKPLPATLDQLVNGNLDNQFAEIEGIVTAVHDRQLVLLLQEGKITLDLRDLRPASLSGCENALIRIRGCVYADFNQETRKFGTGLVTVRSAAIEVLQPAPHDLFDAPPRSLDELLLYDPKAAPFHFLKASGQIIYGRTREYILTDGTNGMSVTLRNSNSFSVGDVVDAVGFLELGGPDIELKEAVMRKTGHRSLPPPKHLTAGQLLQASYADTLVQMDATLMNQWREGSEYVLELQSGFLAFRARFNSDGRKVHLPPSGSRVQLTGAYAPQGVRADEGTVGGFELLLLSPADIHILAVPPWWNLKRVLVLAAILGGSLLAVLFWNTELHRKVQERGRLLELEIRNRQQAELQQAAEAERSRIARDLHDELGTGLTEVSMLAGTGLAESRGSKKTHDCFQVIAERARALVSGLDVIVWAIDPKRNSLQSFADYLGRYATELFSTTAIVCRFEIPIECDAVALTEAARHSLFLAVKEALNNVIRHASATEVELQMSQSEGRLHVVIADNGRGFDINTVRRVNGLTNLRHRLEALNGECHIESVIGKGTTVKFSVPLPRNPN